MSIRGVPVTSIESLEGRVLMAAVPRPDHVVIAIEENRSFDGMIGSPDAPYINSLASQGAVFTRRGR